MDYDDETVQNIADQTWSACLKKEMPPSWGEVKPGEGKKEEELKVHYGRAFASSQAMIADVFLALSDYDTWLLDKYPGEEDRRTFQRINAIGNESYWVQRNFEQVVKREFEALDMGIAHSWSRQAASHRDE